jgi:tRNA threonylcarbamoyladenosine biosynthesis protein TsaE
LRWTSRSPEATRAAARELAQSLGGRGLVVALVGPLGAGKTAFVQGLAEGLGLDPAEVASPTFAIASEYPERDGLRLVHADLYRLESEAELEATGFRDLLVPAVVLAVEWADRFPAALPSDRLEVRIERGAGAAATHRAILAVALGPAAAGVLGRWRRARRPEGAARRPRGRRGKGGAALR